MKTPSGVEPSCSVRTDGRTNDEANGRFSQILRKAPNKWHAKILVIRIYVCYILLLRRNCLKTQIIEGKIKGQIEVTRRRGRRCKKLLDNLKDRRG